MSMTKNIKIGSYRQLLIDLAKGNYDDFSADPRDWASTKAYLCLGGNIKNGQKIDSIEDL